MTDISGSGILQLGSVKYLTVMDKLIKIYHSKLVRSILYVLYTTYEYTDRRFKVILLEDKSNVTFIVSEQEEYTEHPIVVNFEYGGTPTLIRFNVHKSELENREDEQKLLELEFILNIQNNNLDCCFGINNTTTVDDIITKYSRIMDLYETVSRNEELSMMT